MQDTKRSWVRWGIVWIVGLAGGVIVGWFALLALVALLLVLTVPSCEVDLGGDDDSNPALERAIARCDVEAVEDELIKGGDPFDGGAFELFGGGGPTMADALACGPGMTALLTRYSVGNDGGDAVLHAAVASGDPELATAALDAGAYVDGQDDAGDTPLLDAVTANDGTMVELLLERGADPDVANDAGHTPLLRAIGFDRPLLVARLLAGGSNPNAPARVTPLEVSIAANGGDGSGTTVPGTEPAGQLVLRVLGPALGYPQLADPEGLGAPSAIEPVTPLYAAVALSTDEVVLALLDAGADPTVGSGPAGHLPADAAELLGRTELAARIRAAAEAP